MKMTLPAMWIRQNMLHSPSPSPYINNERTLTEAELKVQRSLQKLSIPEWYLNNSARPPKILMNYTPIESRPPVWKEQLLDKTIVCSTPVMPARNLTVNRNGLLETEIGPPQSQMYSAYKISRSSPIERLPVAKKRVALSQRSQVSDKKSSRSRLMNISGTFPRISPSRKIQHINIVFPQRSSNSLSHTIAEINHEESQMDMTKDSLEAIASPEVNDGDPETSRLADASAMSYFSERKISRMPNQKLTYIKPWKAPAPCGTPDGKLSSGHSFKLRASSTPQGSPVSLFSESAVDASLPKQKKMLPPVRSLFAAPEASKEIRQAPPVAARTIKPVSSEEEEICDACKADVFRRFSPSPRSRPSSSFQPNSLCPIGEKRPSTPRLRAASPVGTDSPSVAFFASKNKSSELENIVKRKQPQQDDKSLLQDIIEELNEKCRNSVQPTYATPGSKNFVKKLVKALEKGTLPRSLEEEAAMACERLLDYPEDDEEVESSEHGSEDDAKSAAVSTSISYKDTDSSNSSDSELRSPTIKQDYSYDWNMNVQKNMNETVTANSETKILEREEDSVYWIPVAKSKLPRTSSRLSMISRLSNNSPGQQSPCVSPIRQNNEGRKSQTSTNAWGMTYRTSDYARTLRRIDETTILDSGYSDRSRGPSSRSSDDTWYDDTESTQASLEIGFCNSFSFGSYLRRSRTQFVGRPFVI